MKAQIWFEEETTVFDAKKAGAQIAALRKAKRLTQSEVGERLHISYQAVSKWERGESLPDIPVLVGLARILETTTDNILCGGEKLAQYEKTITVEQMKRGILCLKNMGELLGKDNLIYRSAIAGINEKMNTDIDSCFDDDYLFECWVAEAAMQNILAGAYIDPSDVQKNFRHEHFKEIVLAYAQKFGMV